MTRLFDLSRAPYIVPLQRPYIGFPYRPIYRARPTPHTGRIHHTPYTPPTPTTAHYHTGPLLPHYPHIHTVLTLAALTTLC